MTLLQAVVLGLIQGITEFLPVSSSAHLILAPWFFNWPDPGLAFDVALHWGTLFAVVLYYRGDLIILAKDFCLSFAGQKTPNGRLAWYLVAATVPATVVGVLIQHYAEKSLRSPWILAGTLAGVAGLLFFADHRRENRISLAELTLRQAVIIGFAQSLALIPGVSRSGITISTALLLGLARPDAVQFSFLMSIPVTLGAGLLKVGYLVRNADNPSVWAGLIVSCLSGLAAIHFLVTFVRRRNFTPFVIYRLALAGVIVVWIFLR